MAELEDGELGSDVAICREIYRPRIASSEVMVALPKDEARRLCDQAALRLESAGAHYTIESAADIVPAILDIERRLQSGESPVSAMTTRSS
ncbi:MAG TPA: hypothetical protein VMV10_05945 [Pirellulales bacterium]|nr:hypothetical protein [Pirellulales bacterium]